MGLYDKSNDPSDYTSRTRTIMIEVGYSVDKIVKAISGARCVGELNKERQPCGCRVPGFG